MASVGGLQTENEEGAAARFLSVPEVAEILAVPRSWVYKQAEARRIPYYKVGHYLRFDPADISAYVRRNRIELADA